MPSYPSFLLPTDSVKLRFREPYMSEGNNLKMSGIVPFGIYNGFTPSPLGSNPNILVLSVDGTRNDSVAVGETYSTNYNLTIRAEQQIQLDFTGHTVFPCWVVLRPSYSIVAHPFSGVTNAQIVTIDSIWPINDSLPRSLHHGDIKICRIYTGLPLTGHIGTVIPTDRDDNGGTLVTQTQLAGAIAGSFPSLAGTYTFSVSTVFNGAVFGSFIPAATLTLGGFRANQLICLSCVGGATDSAGSNDTARLGFTIDGTATGSLDGGPGDIYVYTTTSRGNNISFSVWRTVSAGSHTFELKGFADHSSIYAGSRFTVSRF